VTYCIGQIIKVDNGHRVIKIASMTKNYFYIPDDWPMCGDGRVYNPKFCKPYNGALSVLNLDSD
jgi:hypothetical protein